MELVMPRNYVEMEQEEMMYLEGGVYLSKSDCRSIIAGLGMSPATFIAAAYGATVTAKVLKWMKAGGPLAWVVGIVGGVASSVIGRVAYCIGYGALNKGCDIKASPYPWEGFVSTTVR